MDTCSRGLRLAERIVRVGLVWCEHKQRGRDTKGLRVQVIGQLSGLHSGPTLVQRGALRAKLSHVPYVFQFLFSGTI